MKYIISILTLLLLVFLGYIQTTKKQIIQPFITVLSYVHIIQTGNNEEFSYQIDSNNLTGVLLSNLKHIPHHYYGRAQLISGDHSVGIPINAAIQFSGYHIPLIVLGEKPLSMKSLFSDMKKEIAISGDLSLEKSNYLPSDCSNNLDGKPDFDIRFDSGTITEGNQSIALISRNHNACIAPEIEAYLDSRLHYELSIDYRPITGNPGALYLSLSLSGATYISEFQLTGSNGKRTNNKFIIDPNINGMAKGAFFIYSYAENGGYTENQYDNLKIHSLYPKSFTNEQFSYNNFTDTNTPSYIVKHGSSNTTTLDIGAINSNKIIYINRKGASAFQILDKKKRQLLFIPIQGGYNGFLLQKNDCLHGCNIILEY